MTTIESEYARLKALADAATSGPWSAHDGVRQFEMPEYSGGTRTETACACGIVCAPDVQIAFAVGADDEDHTLGEGVSISQKAKNAAFIASAHDMMALIERLMEERKTAERLAPVQGHPHQGCYQSQLEEQTASIFTRDAGPAAFGGRKTRREP